MGFFQTKKLVLCRQVSDRFSIVSLATGSTYVMFVKPTPSVVFEGTQIRLTKSTNDGGVGIFLRFMVFLSLEHHLRNVMENKHGIRHGNGILEQVEQLNWLSHSPNLGSEITSWSIEFDMPHGEVATMPV